ncbi:50S ribosomal protein L13 [Candidatus Shapirobacteria bacterium]|nr:50S ribosomal protein L13 [Candidatus Shapirobacteria bacterium]
MKTYSPKKREIKREWYLFDAKGEILGRLATQIAHLLMGKNKPTFSYHLDSGDYVVVINAARVRVTGTKVKNKVYQHYTGYPGGLREVSLRELMEKKPTAAVKRAVWGMLPKNKLRKKRIKRLKIFAKAEHPYEKKEIHLL